MRLLAALVALLPWRLLAPLGAGLGFLCGSVLRIRRAHVEDAMRRAGLAHAEKSYASLGRGLFELLWLAGASKERRAEILERHVTVSPEAARALDAALAEGPVVVFASHTGNWELGAFAAARLLAARGRRLAVVAKPISARAVDAFTRRLREAFGLSLLSPRGACAAALRLLRAGDVVAFPVDQVPDSTSHAIELPFLGAGALVDRAPATIAYRARATVLVVGAARDGDLVRVELLDTIAARDAGVVGATARATAALARFVEEHPHDWLWLHRRWRRPWTRGETHARCSPEHA